MCAEGLPPSELGWCIKADCLNLHQLKSHPNFQIAPGWMKVSTTAHCSQALFLWPALLFLLIKSAILTQEVSSRLLEWGYVSDFAFLGS